MNPAAIRAVPSKTELLGEISRLRSHIHNLRASLRTTDAKFQELLRKQPYFPSASDEAVLDNNKIVLKHWEQGTY